MKQLSFIDKVVFAFRNPRFAVGFGFSFIGTLFCISFVPQVDTTTPFFTADNTMQVQGHLQHTSETNLKVNKHRVYAYTFSFTPIGSSERIKGVSYSSDIVEGGKPVSITYRKDDPTIAVITGTRANTFPLFVLLVLLIPLMGLRNLLKGIPKTLRLIRIYQNGSYTQGEFVEVVPTKKRVNKNRVHAYKYAYEIDGQVHMVEFHTHKAGIAPKSAVVMYANDNPSDGIVLQEFPSKIADELHSDARNHGVDKSTEMVSV